VSEQSAIEWTNATWNWATGCTKVSPGCANCYIERTPPFRIAGRRFERGRIPVILHPERLDAPLRWTKPRMVFTLSLGDVFHEDIPFEFLERVWRVMNDAPQHTFQVLTKRPERMLEFYQWMEAKHLPQLPGAMAAGTWPLPNVWAMTSVENQYWADRRIPAILRVPAAVHGLSCEPLLGPLDVTPWLHIDCPTAGCRPPQTGRCAPGIDWVIVGGESGPGSDRRKLVERTPDAVQFVHGQTICTSATCHLFASYMPNPNYERKNHKWHPKQEALEWVRSLQRQCQAAGGPFFFKQWGGRLPTSGGRLLDGREWNEMPLREAVADGAQ